MRAGMVVSAATTSTVPATTASSCQYVGSPRRRSAAQRASPPATPRTAPANAGSTCAAERPALTSPGGRAEGTGQRRGVPGVERGRPGDDDRVDCRQGDQHDRDHQQHLVRPLGLRVQTGGPSQSAAIAARPASTATIPLTVTAMLATPSRTRRGRRAITRKPRSRGTGSRAESAISQAYAGVGGRSRPGPERCWCGRRGRQKRRSRAPRPPGPRP